MSNSLVLTYWKIFLQFMRITRTWYIYPFSFFINSKTDQFQNCVGESFSQSIVSSSSTFLEIRILSQMDSQESLIMWTRWSDIYDQNDSISRIFRLGGERNEETKILGVVNEEDESGGEEELDEYGITGRHEFFAIYTHLSWDILAWSSMSLGGHSLGWYASKRLQLDWRVWGMPEDQRPPDQDQVVVVFLSVHLLLYL